MEVLNFMFLDNCFGSLGEKFWGYNYICNWEGYNKLFFIVVLVVLILICRWFFWKVFNIVI